jgi:hypothetical protein
MTQTTPQEAIVRMLINNPQPMSFPTLAAAILAVLEHEGWKVVRREMADAE